MTVKTRFAPSPTGHLHIGGARTALFSWLHAKQHQGHFVLRIEDTDRERSMQEYVDAILEGMAWLGLDHDEGPFYQTQRFDRYQAVIDQLLAEGKAYRCYCSKARLEALRETQMRDKQKPRYDGHCRDLTEPPNENPPVIRFRNPLSGQVQVNDLIRGTVVFDNRELDDLIIARSDGTPTYNLTVVVDDADMGITHVIRGDDHLNNTPRQINILEAMGYQAPAYAHVPMILGADGKRLSKRHGAVSVLQYRDEGYLPDALLNYLVRLGWAHGDQEVFSREEMRDLFKIEEVNRAASTFNPDKLLWLNQHYLKNADSSYVARHLQWHMARLGVDVSQGPPLSEVVVALRERSKTLVEMAVGARFFYENFAEYEPKAARKNLTAEAGPVLQALAAHLEEVAHWDAETIHRVVEGLAETRELKLGKVAQPLRVAVSGTSVSPPIDVTLALLGKATTLDRLQRAIAFIERGE
ncbi:MAG: glutamate--tRNA ligase [Pseudomonadota bacterium]|nr:glutamate--tRNA ligase [Pseudomonadota bacterium]